MKIKAIASLLGLFLAIILLQSNAGNPPTSLGNIVNGQIGAFNCFTCHDNGIIAPPDSFNGGLSLNFSGGNLYQNNTTYDLTLSIDTPNVRHGFQIVVTDSLFKQIGAFIVGSSEQQIQEELVWISGPPYDTLHLLTHKDIPASNAASFDFQWQAPSNYQGTIHFTAMAVAANGDGVANIDSTDHAYYDRWSFEASPVPVHKIQADTELIRAFPNPAQNQISIDFQQVQKPALLSVYNLNGQTIFQQPLNPGPQQTQLSISDWASGTYLVEIKTGEGKSYTQKIQKQ